MCRQVGHVEHCRGFGTSSERLLACDVALSHSKIDTTEIDTTEKAQSPGKYILWPDSFNLDSELTL